MTYFKQKTIRSKKLTKAAKGNPCTAHTPKCNGDRSTVVFCHAPSEDKGTAFKSPDWWGADCCSACHYWLDFEATEQQARDYWMRAIYRTLKRRFNQNLINVN